MGRCEMELKRVDQALAHFLRTQEMLKVQIKTLTMTASGGAASGAANAGSVEEMIKPSIFDTEEIKRVKGIMLEVQEYIQEIEYNKANHAELEKERNEAKRKADEKASESNVPEGFGKPQPNADQFQTVSFTVKKKRTHQEMMQ